MSKYISIDDVIGALKSDKTFRDAVLDLYNEIFEELDPTTGEYE